MTCFTTPIQSFHEYRLDKSYGRVHGAQGSEEPANFRLNSRKGRAPLTIAAGFRFDGGIFLCADSQITYGSGLKTKGKKVMSGSFKRIPAKLGFATIGDIPQATSAIRKVLTHIDSLPSTATPGDVFDAIEVAVQKAYSPIFRHPLYKDEKAPWFCLLMCLWMEGQPSVLLKTHEDVVNQVPQWDCSGSGESLFRYIVDDLYTPDMGLQEVITLATYALKEIRDFDPNVGFTSEFMTFFEDQKSFSQVAEYDVKNMENFGSLTKREFFRYMFVMADLRKTDAEMLESKQLFEANLLNLRRQYLQEKTTRKGIEQLYQALSRTDVSISFKLPRRRSTPQT